MKDIDVNQFKTIEDLEAYRTKINEACDKRKQMLTFINNANELSNMSFAYLKESCECFAPSLFESKEGRAIMKKYTSLIKKNKDLSKMHNLCECIRKTSKDADIDFFVNNISDSKLEIDKTNLEEGRKELGKVLAEAYLVLGEKANSLLPVHDVVLDNAVTFIAENTKTIKNLPEYSAAIKVIKEHIELNENVIDSFNKRDVDAVSVDLVREFNEKYAEQLSDEEKQIVKEVAESANPQEIFNKYKTSCIDKINEIKKTFELEKNESSIKRLSAIQEQVMKKEFSSDTIGEDICNFIEITKVFE